MDTRTTCLGVLAMGDASGYEIRKHFDEGPFSHFADGGYGSIYPALTKLTAEGLLTCTAQSQDGRPDKKVYRITAAGRRALLDAMHRMPGEDKFRSDFLFIMFFADHQEPDWVAQVIDARIAYYREKLDRMQDCAHACEAAGPMAGAKLVHGYGMAVYQAALEYLETNRAAFVAAAGTASAPGVEAAE